MCTGWHLPRAGNTHFRPLFLVMWDFSPIPSSSRVVSSLSTFWNYFLALLSNIQFEERSSRAVSARGYRFAFWASVFSVREARTLSKERKRVRGRAGFSKSRICFVVFSANRRTGVPGGCEWGLHEEKRRNAAEKE